jgi:hypothetical protein
MLSLTDAGGRHSAARQAIAVSCTGGGGADGKALLLEWETRALHERMSAIALSLKDRVVLGREGLGGFT